MDKVKNAFNKVKTMLTTKTGMISGVVVLIIIGFIGYSYMSKFKLAIPGVTESFESSQNNDSAEPIELMMFSVDWCPHCKSAKPEWEKLVQSNKAINGKKIIFTSVNCTEETPEIESLIKKYNIEGYPTIILLKGGKVIPYESKPTEALLGKFLSSNV